MLEIIIHYDRALFYILNTEWTTPFLDYLMPFIRNKLFWMPLYVFILSFLVINFKKQGFFLFLFMLLVVLVCDQTSSAVLKPLFNRLRPCDDPSFQEFVRLLMPDCGGRSFPSSHATNHFGIAAFFSLIFYKEFKWVGPVLFGWALLVGYAQIYVGLHYPLDIAAGAVAGFVLGLFIAVICKRTVMLNFRSDE